MNQQELLDHMRETYTKCLDTAKAKNNDYAGQGNDGFNNFGFVERLRVTSTVTGLLVRICDKFARMINLTQQVAAVKDESLSDTIRDLINYLAILLAVLSDKRDQETKSDFDQIEMLKTLRDKHDD